MPPGLVPIATFGLCPSVYWLYDSDLKLLYVGSTRRPVAVRLRQHASAQPWWSEVAFVRTETFETEGQMLEAESTAIRSGRPSFNVYETGERPEPPLRDLRTIGNVASDHRRALRLAEAREQINAALVAGWTAAELSELTWLPPPLIEEVGTANWPPYQEVVVMLIQVEQLHQRHHRKFLGGRMTPSQWLKSKAALRSRRQEILYPLWIPRAASSREAISPTTT